MQDPSQSAAAIQQQQQILLAQMMGGTGRTLPLPYLTTQVRVQARNLCMWGEMHVVFSRPELL